MSHAVLLRGGTLLTLDADASILRSTDLLLQDGRIAALGSSLELPPGGRSYDVSGQIVMPGLVQGHVHLGQTLFRGLAEQRRLLAWLRERIWPLEAAHDEESAYWSGRLGAAECLLGGTSTIQDIGIGPGCAGLLDAIADSGLRAIAGKCLMDEGEGLPARLAEPTQRTLHEAIELAIRFERKGEGRLRAALNPRFILSCSDALWRELAAVAAERGWPVHTHALEQRDEGAAVRRVKQGRDEIEYFDDAGILAGRISIAHGVWLRRSHLERLDGGRFGVVHCPGSNLKLGSGVAPVGRIRRAGIPVGIGADGAPCNNRLDAWSELRLAAGLASVREGPASFSGLDALRLATSEGARAIGLGDEIGSLEVGKAADVLVIDPSSPELVGDATVDPHDLVAFGASPASVRHLFVAGVARVEEGELASGDLAEILSRARRALGALVARADLH